MHQPRNELAPDEGVDVPKVRPQGAMCSYYAVAPRSGLDEANR